MDLTKNLTEEDLKEVTQTNIYENDDKDQWELWVVDTQGNKDLVGVCLYSCGEELVDVMVEEHTFLTDEWEAGNLPQPIFEAVDLTSFQGNTPTVSMYMQ